MQTKLQAVRSGNGFKLNGAKAFVVDGHTADLLIVAARSGGAAGERNGLTLFLVDPKAKGVAIERTAMVDSHNAARIEFADVEVNADQVLGEVDQGAALLEGLLNIGRGAVASEMVGLSEEVFGRTVTYLKERKQFGKLIGEFQALQHRAAELYIDIEITRAAVLKALQTLDGDFDHAGAAVAVAKARAGTTATRAVQEGVQMHGGMGMTDQFDIGFFMKRARVCQELFGDANYPRRSIGADEELLSLSPHGEEPRMRGVSNHVASILRDARSRASQDKGAAAVYRPVVPGSLRAPE